MRFLRTSFEPIKLYSAFLCYSVSQFCRWYKPHLYRTIIKIYWLFILHDMISHRWNFQFFIKQSLLSMLLVILIWIQIETSIIPSWNTKPRCINQVFRQVLYSYSYNIAFVIIHIMDRDSSHVNIILYHVTSLLLYDRWILYPFCCNC